ncbi:MAG: hypothetical protein CMN31_16980 [Sandaracinus sp.]|nr:hypothetical protein [Myxococcales bacterium]MAT28315.1 hypothetical protein [Sandaracinus sp.]MBJ73007.1 hypothetical protein [Sandaracinus sp.]
MRARGEPPKGSRVVRLDPDRFLSRRRRAHLRRWDVTETADEVLFARTDDGWHVALSRYRTQVTRRHPVLLIHGLGANRLAWDLGPEVSLASWLARRGFDVFSLDLRGHGRSEKPRLFDPKDWGWSIEEYATVDVPAALEAVLEVTGAPGVHAVGHSMGGILTGRRLAEGDARIRSAVTVGSALDYSGTKSIFHLAKKLVWASWLIWPPVLPMGPAAALMAPFALAFDNAIDRINVHASNVDRRLYRRLVATAFHPISVPVLRTLAQAFEPGGLRLADGRTVIEALPEGVPVRSLAGSADTQCAPEAAARHATELTAFGEAHGHEDEYGHFDLVMGRRAAREVWPSVLEWCVDHDG